MNNNQGQLTFIDQIINSLNSDRDNMENSQKKHHIFSVEKAHTLECWYRRLLQPPHKILSRYLHPGMTAIDLGCGSGYFTFPMADIVGNSGRIMAVDIQQGMLDIIEQKKRSGSHQYDHVSSCCSDELLLKQNLNVDFILACYVLHEVADLDPMLVNLCGMLKPGGKLLITEPGIFGFSVSHFASTIERIRELGLTVAPENNIYFTKSICATKPQP